MANKRKFWSNKEIKKIGAEWNFIIGGRNLGKSFCIKIEEGLKKSWIEHKPTFMLVRRYDLECKPSHIENYFADVDVEAITNGQYNIITAKGGTIYFSTYDFDTGKTKQGIACGKYVSLSSSTHIKSEAFPYITDVINEEICTTKYLENEVRLLFNLISTIARSRKIVIWGIGNTVNRMNPYFNYFGIDFRKLKQGEITLYKFVSDVIDENGERQIIKVAVEYCSSDSAENSLFIGTEASSINDGAFECSAHPRLSSTPDKYDVLYECLLKGELNYSFVLQLLVNEDTGKLLLYSYPYTNKVKKYDRILSTEYSEEWGHSVWFNRDDEIESIIIDLLNQQQIAFSDNLTGEECIQVLYKLKSSTL